MKTVEVKAGDITYKLHLGCNELVELQKALNVKRVSDLVDLSSFEQVRTVAWHALRKCQPSMTPEEAGEVVTEVGLEAMGEGIVLALEWALPKLSAERAQA